MVSRVAGALALTGGVAWLVKVALIWGNGGTNTTDGVVGLLFSVGAVSIVLAAAIRAWYARPAAPFAQRLLAVLLAVVAFAAAVNVPILGGWLVFGQGSWAAEEVGVVLTALAALVLGQGWWRAAGSFGTERPARP